MGPQRANETSVHRNHSHFRPKKGRQPGFVSAHPSPYIRQLLCIPEPERVSKYRPFTAPVVQPLTSSSTPWQSLHTVHDQSCRAVQRSESVKVNLKLHTWAMSGTNGSSGLGSVNREQIESSTAN